MQVYELLIRCFINYLSEQLTNDEVIKGEARNHMTPKESR